MDDYKSRILRVRKENKEKMIDQIAIVDLARDLGYNIIPHGHVYKLAEHDSCIIYPKTKTFKRYSTGSQGDIFKFLQEFNEMNFNQAYNYLLEKIDPTKVSIPKEEKIYKKEKLTSQQRTRILIDQINPFLDDNCKNVMAYLIQTRKINPKIVYEYIKNNLIKQQTNEFGFKNAVFLGYDQNGMLASASYRACGTTSSSRGDFKECDYRFGWLYEPTINNSSFCPEHNYQKPCIITESVIDQMSLISLFHEKNIDPKNYGFNDSIIKLLSDNNYDYNNFNWLAIGSVEKKAAIYHMQESFGTKDFIIALDNDAAGIKASNEINNYLKDKGCNTFTINSLDNDWNSDLCNMKCSDLSRRIDKAKIYKNQTDTGKNIFNSKTQVIVNPVNLKGVMSAGLALEFKKRYPDMYIEYQKKCINGELKEGTLDLYKSKDGVWILNFPTKSSWNEKSSLKLISTGLNTLSRTYKEMSITSITFPRIGCGLGGLDWEKDVKPLIQEHLNKTDLKISYCEEPFELKTNIKSKQNMI